MLDRNNPLQLATSRYQARALIMASGLAPVRITLGAPRFPLGYELAGNLPELAPSPRIFPLPWDRFATAYLRQLDRVDWQSVEKQLSIIATAARAPGAVFLCFEDVLAGERCHRQLLAEHWAERTGQRMSELRAEDELTLFQI